MPSNNTVFSVQGVPTSAGDTQDVPGLRNWSTQVSGTVTAGNDMSDNWSAVAHGTVMHVMWWRFSRIGGFFFGKFF